MRDTTERPEGVEAETLKLVGTSEDVIYNEFSKLINDKNEYAKMAKAVNPYGDGKACERIVDAILYYFKLKNEKPNEIAISGISGELIKKYLDIDIIDVLVAVVIVEDSLYGFFDF